MSAIALTADRSAVTTVGGTAFSLVALLFLVAAMAPPAIQAMMG